MIEKIDNGDCDFIFPILIASKSNSINKNKKSYFLCARKTIAGKFLSVSKRIVGIKLLLLLI